MKKTVLFTASLLTAVLVHAVTDGPLTPEQAIASFRLDPGLKIECVAQEPMVVSPVAAAWDEKGRMYVVEDRGYPVGPGKGKKPVGQVVLLESTHHDGHYDKRTVFADGLTFPNGVMCWKGGVYVTCAPYLYYFKDTDGDGVADVKQIVFKGFQDLSTTQLRVSHPILNVDGWVYLTSGLTSAKVSSPIYTNHPVVFCNRTDFRFKPDTDQFEPTAGTAQFGETFDSFGHKFICSNRNHNQAVMMQLKYLNRNTNAALADIVEDIPDHGAASKLYPLSDNITTSALHTGFFTSACGINYYRGTALPDDYKDNSFTCEPAGNLVHRDVISPTNTSFVAKRAQDGVDFLASPDNWFRPVNLATGPDGALYVCDMYRKTIEHPEYLPEATRKITDFESGKDKGRIYRITAASYKVQTKQFDVSTSKELCELLNSPDAWWRTTAQRLLLERQDKSVASTLKKMVKSGKIPEARVLALRLLECLNSLEDQQILTALSDKNVSVRENAMQVAEPRLSQSSRLTERLLAMANDSDARVRFQCALSLGELHDAKIIPALAKILDQNNDDKWTREAVLSAVDNHADVLLKTLLAGKNKDAAGMSAMLVELCRILGTSETPDKLASLLNQVTASNSDADAAWQQAAVTGIAEGIRVRGLVGKDQSPLLSLTSGDSTEAKLTRVRVEELVQRAVSSVKDANASLSQRLAAVGLLAQSEFSVSGKTLQSLIDPQQPAELQVAAVRALGRMPDADAGTVLVRKDRWSSYSPPVRDAALTSIMAKPRLIQTMLIAIESGDVPAWTVNEDRRTQLMHNKDESIAKRASAIFKDMQAGDRMKVYEEYKSVLAFKPDSKNGHAIFTKTCTGCHVVSGEGKTVGPDLTGIRNQPSDVLLLHIIVPEYEIMPTYTCYNVETKDGRSLTGLLAAESASNITLRQALGHEEIIPRSNIASMSASSLSLMPDELEKTMSKQDMADLVGFLKGM
ncbi:PVC-type heme-binding CxxCH protein [Pedosphaera parvula]|uniref:Membrane-bound dehydrogenase domain protein n=1 Tax=Pedosphaera parvula (strain Ellin514) TaxID=320771 RepID=B9XM58_PEDPL|nr:PVC-type heme-binding CxxCH protein [Pedosphaera parvula]EEF59051.1 membrane-bound dehydrogenase domain protein [Pedosphaera parvula Ellin514]